jgi:NAD(P)-dependent dehydrogenase (short-subunit alcohol dehydrogenase family)
MPTTLITGANRGLGLEFARQYAAEGWRVFAGARDPSRADELQALAARWPETVRVEALDVTDAASVAALAGRLAGQPIDLLVNNAGRGGQPGADVLGRIDYDLWSELLAANTLGPMRVTEALIENIAGSEKKQVVTITSGLGSLSVLASGDIPGFGPAYQYRTSKAAVNMAMLALAHEVRPRRITVVLFSPGWVRTDMGGPNAPLTPPESIAGMRRVIAGLTLEQSGRFLNHDGTEVPW